MHEFSFVTSHINSAKKLICLDDVYKQKNVHPGNRYAFLLIIPTEQVPNSIYGNDLLSYKVIDKAYNKYGDLIEGFSAVFKILKQSPHHRAEI